MWYILKLLLATIFNSKGERVVQPIRRQAIELPLEGIIRDVPAGHAVWQWGHFDPKKTPE